MTMDEQTRATFVLAATTIAAAKIQDHNHSTKGTVKILIDVLQEMEKQGIVPSGTDKGEPKYYDPIPRMSSGQ